MRQIVKTPDGEWVVSIDGVSVGTVCRIGRQRGSAAIPKKPAHFLAFKRGGAPPTKHSSLAQAGKSFER